MRTDYPGSESSRELSFPVAKVPENFRSWELSFPGAKVPGNFRSRERKFSVGTLAPRSENTEERKVLIPSTKPNPNPSPTLILCTQHYLNYDAKVYNSSLPKVATKVAFDKSFRMVEPINLTGAWLNLDTQYALQ